MKRMMMAVVLAVAGIAAADSDVDTFKTVLEKVADAETQYRIGNCYAEGKGLVKDEGEAFKWYRKAAEQGHADAQDSLAKCYYYGRGVTTNATQVVYWFRKAAAQGQLQSIHNLGSCYLYVKGEKGW